MSRLLVCWNIYYSRLKRSQECTVCIVVYMLSMEQPDWPTERCSFHGTSHHVSGSWRAASLCCLIPSYRPVSVAIAGYQWLRWPGCEVGFLKRYISATAYFHDGFINYHVAKIAYPLVNLRVHSTEYCIRSYWWFLLCTYFTIYGVRTCHCVGQWVVSQGLDYFHGKQDTQSGNVLAGIITRPATQGARRKSRRGLYQLIGCHDGLTPVPLPTCQLDPPRSSIANL